MKNLLPLFFLLYEVFRKIMSKKSYITLLLLLLISSAYSTTYYVSATEGKNYYSGKSQKNPWRSLRNVNSMNLEPGDSVLFKRGDVWRGQLIPKTSGTANHLIYFGAYGIGSKPLFLGSVNKSDPNEWKEYKQGIWRTKLSIANDVGNIIIHDKADLACKRTTLRKLKNKNDFYSEKNQLYWLSSVNPAIQHNNIELALTKNIVHVLGKKYLIFDNLAVRYGGGHGFSCTNTENITIKSCDISYIGGGYLAIGERYGNGIEFWGDAKNNIVEQNHVHQIYDNAMTNQASKGKQENIIYRNNFISNCELPFSYWNKGERKDSYTKNIFFVNNTSIYAGDTWGSNQRHDIRPSHIIIGRDSVNLREMDFKVFIKNNIFFEATNIYESKGVFNKAKSTFVTFLDSYSPKNIKFQNNLFFDSNNPKEQVVVFYNQGSKNNWTCKKTDYINLNYYLFEKDFCDTHFDDRVSLGYEDFIKDLYSLLRKNGIKTYKLNSIFKNPNFIDEINNNIRFDKSSICVDSGIESPESGSLDFFGNKRIKNRGIDIGCFEF